MSSSIKKYPIRTDSERPDLGKWEEILNYTTFVRFSEETDEQFKKRYDVWKASQPFIIEEAQETWLRKD